MSKFLNFGKWYIYFNLGGYESNFGISFHFKRFFKKEFWGYNDNYYGGVHPTFGFGFFSIDWFEDWFKKIWNNKYNIGDVVTFDAAVVNDYWHGPFLIVDKKRDRLIFTYDLLDLRHNCSIKKAIEISRSWNVVKLLSGNKKD